MHSIYHRGSSARHPGPITPPRYKPQLRENAESGAAWDRICTVAYGVAFHWPNFYGTLLAHLKLVV